MVLIERKRVSSEEKEKFLQENGYEWVLRTERIADVEKRWKHILREHQPAWYLISPAQEPVIRASLPLDVENGIKRDSGFAVAVSENIQARNFKPHFDAINGRWFLVHNDLKSHEFNTINPIEAIDTIAVILCGVPEDKTFDMQAYIDSKDRIVLLLQEMGQHKDHTSYDNIISDMANEASQILRELGLPT
jgi:hypothetical protein